MDKDIIEEVESEQRQSAEFSEEADNAHSCFSIKNRISDFFAELPAHFIIAVSAFCIAVVVAAAVAGVIIPKSETTLQKSISTLRGRDRDYIAAAAAYKNASDENRDLSSSLEDKQAELDEFNQSRDNLDKMAESNAELENEKAELQKDIREKQSTLDSLEASVNSYTNKIVTWSSGDYTAGRDIAAGKYTITGVGSIAVARNGKSIINKNLKSSGESFTFASGDLIHIDGSARLMPE